MTTQQDCSLGFGKESVYGTGVTPARFLEYTGDPKFAFAPTRVQGGATRAGSRVDRSTRRATTAVEASGSFECEILSKGLGLLWEAILGGATSTLVGGTTYQQVFTLSDVVNTYTYQQGIVRDATTMAADTFKGCAVDKATFTFEQAGIPKLAVDLDAREVDTSIAYTAPSYAAGASFLTWKDAAITTGAVTAPTTTALGSAPTALTAVRGGSIEIARNLRKSLVIGNAGKKRKVYAGKPTITGKIDVEYTDAFYRDAYLNDTDLSLVLTFTNGVALSTGFETLQIIVPNLRFEGDWPAPNGDEIPVVSMSFTVLDAGVAAQPIWVVARTSDTAL